MSLDIRQGDALKLLRGLPEGIARCCVTSLPSSGGTTGVVALRHGRRFLGLELNAEYVEMARCRIAGPLFTGADA